MVTYFRKNDNTLMVFVPGALLVGAVIQTAFNTESPNPVYSPLFGFVLLWFSGSVGAWINGILSAIIAGFVFITLNRMVLVSGMLARLSNMPMLVLLVLYFVVPPSVHSVLLWLVFLLMVLFIKQCVTIVSEGGSNTDAVTAAFLCGIGALAYPFFVCAYFVLIAVLVLSSSLTLRSFALTLVGFALPFYFLFSLLYLFSPAAMDALISPAVFQWPDFTSKNGYLAIGLFALILTAVVANNTTLLVAVTLRERRKWQLQQILFAGAMPALFMGGVEAFIALAVLPAAIILSRTFANHPKWWLTEAMFAALLALAAINFWV